MDQEIAVALYSWTDWSSFKGYHEKVRKEADFVDKIEVSRPIKRFRPQVINMSIQYGHQFKATNNGGNSEFIILISVV